MKRFARVFHYTIWSVNGESDTAFIPAAHQNRMPAEAPAQSDVHAPEPSLMTLARRNPLPGAIHRSQALRRDRDSPRDPSAVSLGFTRTSAGRIGQYPPCQRIESLRLSGGYHGHIVIGPANAG